MFQRCVVLISLLFYCLSSFAQSASDFRIALPTHPGRLEWSAKGFEVAQSSAKPNNNEIGIRARNNSAALGFLGFLVWLPDDAPQTGAKCRENFLKETKADTTDFNILKFDEITRPGAMSLSLATYTSKGADGKTWYHVRGFVGTGSLCGDLELYSDHSISASDAGLQGIFQSYRLDETYVPTFGDVVIYAQILYKEQLYQAAAPLFELALEKLGKTPGASDRTKARILTDQAGMAYGISGNTAKARAIFEKAIAEDPDYPMYYYNLACADAQEKNMAGAEKHLREAFARKANMLPGEPIPDPTQDDSFLPYRSDKDFWAFLNSLQGKK